MAISSPAAVVPVFVRDFLTTPRWWPLCVNAPTPAFLLPFPACGFGEEALLLTFDDVLVELLRDFILPETGSVPVLFSVVPSSPMTTDSDTIRKVPCSIIAEEPPAEPRRSGGD